MDLSSSLFLLAVILLIVAASTRAKAKKELSVKFGLTSIVLIATSFAFENKVWLTLVVILIFTGSIFEDELRHTFKKRR
ncbi:MAG TPA: hypothetical protein VK674_05790 [Candidatus Limnocylindria bacterium]|nr:hypothetical protein [Candidatus Limnocylindria bacterium]